MPPQDLDPPKLAQPPKKDPQAQGGVPKSGWRRGLAMTRLGLATGARAAVGKVQDVLGSDAKKDDRQRLLWQTQAKAWVKEMGQLKGSLMKAGQMLAMYGEQFLPPEAVELLRTLQSDAPPVPFAGLKQVLDEDLNAEVNASLRVHPKPCGAASMGQVHRACFLSDDDKNGGDTAVGPIALKVQYPGIRDALQSDLKTLRRLLGLMRMVAPVKEMDALFDEVKKVLGDELDYLREREQTEFFYQALKADRRFVVPKTFASLSSKRVLATSFEEGVSVTDARVQLLSQARRDALGMAYFELYLRELFVLGRIQTDPHFGNFRIRIADEGETDDKLIVLDFGAVRQVSSHYRGAYRRLIRGCLNDDRRDILDAGLELGLLRATDSAQAETVFFDTCRLIAEPFSSKDTPGRDASLFDALGRYRFGDSNLPKRVAARATQLARSVGLRPPSPEALFLDRKLAGVFLFLSAMRAVVDGRALLQRYIEEPEKAFALPRQGTQA